MGIWLLHLWSSTVCLRSRVRKRREELERTLSKVRATVDIVIAICLILVGLLLFHMGHDEAVNELITCERTHGRACTFADDGSVVPVAHTEDDPTGKWKCDTYGNRECG